MFTEVCVVRTAIDTSTNIQSHMFFWETKCNTKEISKLHIRILNVSLEKRTLRLFFFRFVSYF